MHQVRTINLKIWKKIKNRKKKKIFLVFFIFVFAGEMKFFKEFVYLFSYSGVNSYIFWFIYADVI